MVYRRLLSSDMTKGEERIMNAITKRFPQATSVKVEDISGEYVNKSAVSQDGCNLAHRISVDSSTMLLLDIIEISHLIQVYTRK